LWNEPIVIGERTNVQDEVRAFRRSRHWQALTQRSDEVARRRQELPWVRVDKAYRFETDDGSA
jgi:predicted dithiol-disulfide oxidoreductase (DUF899 family)